jgi:hypothetical protein
MPELTDATSLCARANTGPSGALESALPSAYHPVPMSTPTADGALASAAVAYVGSRCAVQHCSG